MNYCLNIDSPEISNLIKLIGYNTLSNIIEYNGIEILDIVQSKPFVDLKNELAKSYEYQLNNKKFNNSIDDMTEISFWRLFTPSFYDWFGNWMIQYKLQNGLQLSEKEQDVLATKYEGSYDRLKADVSKVVTDDGLPKLVYHGSEYDFIDFNTKWWGYAHFGTFEAAYDRLIRFKYGIEKDGYIINGTIKSYFLNIKKEIEIEDVGNKWHTIITNENEGLIYSNKSEDIGSISYATKYPNQIKSAILPSDDMSVLLVENLVEELKITPDKAKQLIPTKFLNPTDNKVMYFQRLNEGTFGFVTSDGKVFIDKSTQSLNTAFHEFYHIYDKIILSNYNFDDRAKSIIDRLNELVIEAGYLDKVKQLEAYKDDDEEQQLAEARAMLIGDASSSKINEAERGFLMKLKVLLKDLVDYILDLIGTKSFKNYTPEQILNMTMEEFTNVMTHEMMYDRSFSSNYIGNFSEIGKGTFEGDGKDKAMRNVAVGFIGELNPNKEDRFESSTYGSFKHFINDDVIEEDRYIHNIPNDTSNGNKIMLALNGSINDNDILQKTKDKILELHNRGFEFVIGDMPSTKNRLGDDMFVNYLKSIGAKYTVYGNGKESRLSTKLTPEQRKNIQELKDLEPAYAQASDEEVQEFIESIYPESQVKNILWNLGKSKITNYNKSFLKDEKGFFFGDDLNLLLNAGIYGNNVNAVIINSQNIRQEILNLPDYKGDDLDIIIGLKDDPDEIKRYKKTKAELIDESIGSYDSLKIRLYDRGFNGLQNQYIVFEPEQITILNSPETIQKFQEFLDRKRNYIQFQYEKSIKPGVEELFESNPELANSVYEALGFKRKEYSTSKKRLQGSTELVDDVASLMKDKSFVDKYIGFRKYFNIVTDIETMVGTYGNYKQGLTQPESVLQELQNLIDSHIEGVNYNLTPQQKQQALQLYSQYLDTNPQTERGSKQDIKGFKEFIGKEKSNIQFQDLSSNQVNYSLKAISIISNNLPTIDKWFKQLNNTDLFWNKVQQDLQIPKDQIELLKNSEGNTIEEKLLNFASKYGYVIEVNTATTNKSFTPMLKDLDYEIKFNWEKNNYEVWGDNELLKDNIKTVKRARQEVEKLKENAKENKERRTVTTEYYANLTVPGGTNYTENEIATLLITPSIKGHAEFATDNGIGWFRSDDKLKGSRQATKTRRILEVQSDLFQKGRDKELLIGFDFKLKSVGYKFGSRNQYEIINEQDGIITFRDNETDKYYKKSEKELIEGQNKSLKNKSENQFLQLLNKDNNWVTFFIKSIIQDSAKKGYEKVLFPTGKTIIKIEQFNKIIEKIKEFDDKIKILENSTIDDYVKTGELNEGIEIYRRKDNQSLGHSTLQISKDFTFEDNIRESIDKLKKDKSHYENTEKERLGTINFYENIITNILKKQGYEPVLITDEYGNTWNEITIVPKRDLATIQFQQSNQVIPTQQSETYDYVFQKLFDNFKPYVSELITDRNRANEVLESYDTRKETVYQDLSEYNNENEQEELNWDERWKNDAIQYLPNGNVLITGYRTDKVEGMTGSTAQRGKGLYLSLDRPLKGQGHSIMQIELNPKEIVESSYPPKFWRDLLAMSDEEIEKRGFSRERINKFINSSQYGQFIRNARFVGDIEETRDSDGHLTFASMKSDYLRQGVKAAIGLIESGMPFYGRELVIYDDEAIERALNSKRILSEEEFIDEFNDYIDRSHTKQSYFNSELLGNIDDYQRIGDTDSFNFEKLNKQEQETLTRNITHLSNKLSTITGIPFQIINDPNQRFKGKLDKDKAIINLAYLTDDTPIHEILGHPIIRYIKLNNPELYNNLANEINNSEQGSQILKSTRIKYNDKSDDDIMEESIVELLSLMISNNINKEESRLLKLLKNIYAFFKNVINNIFDNEVKINDNMNFKELSNFLSDKIKRYENQADTYIRDIVRQVFNLELGNEIFEQRPEEIIPPPIKDVFEYFKQKFGETNAKMFRNIIGAYDNPQIFTDFLNELIPDKRHIQYILENNLFQIQNLFTEILDKNNIENEIPIETRTPEEIAESIDYEFHRINTADELLSYKKLYDAGSVICTYNNPEGRLKSSFIFILKRSYADLVIPVFKLTQEYLKQDHEGAKLWREFLIKDNRLKEDGSFDLENLSIKREDPYGTSIMNIQILRSNGSQKVLNRYNHAFELGYPALPSPDYTYAGDLNNLVNGLDDAIRNIEGVPEKNRKSLSNSFNGRVVERNGKLYTYDFEENGIYYNRYGFLNDTGYNEINTNEEMMVGKYFINFRIKKALILSGSFIDLTIDTIRNGMENTSDGHVRINTNIANSNVYSAVRHKDKVTLVGDNDLNKNDRIIFTIEKGYVKTLEANMTVIHTNSFAHMYSLEKAIFSNAEKIRDDVLKNSKELKILEAPLVTDIGNNFLHDNQEMEHLNLPMLRKVGILFLGSNEKLKTLDLPSLEFTEYGFLMNNRDLTILRLPKLKTFDDSALYNNRNLKIIDLPSAHVLGFDFLKMNNELELLFLPNIKDLTYTKLLPSNNILRSIYVPLVETVDYFTFPSGTKLKSLYFPNIKIDNNGMIVKRFSTAVTNNKEINHVYISQDTAEKSGYPNYDKGTLTVLKDEIKFLSHFDILENIDKHKEVAEKESKGLYELYKSFENPEEFLKLFERYFSNNPNKSISNFINHVIDMKSKFNNYDEMVDVNNQILNFKDNESTLTWSINTPNDTILNRLKLNYPKLNFVIKTDLLSNNKKAKLIPDDIVIYAINSLNESVWQPRLYESDIPLAFDLSIFDISDVESDNYVKTKINILNNNRNINHRSTNINDLQNAILSLRDYNQSGKIMYQKRDIIKSYLALYIKLIEMDYNQIMNRINLNADYKFYASLKEMYDYIKDNYNDLVLIMDYQILDVKDFFISAITDPEFQLFLDNTVGNNMLDNIFNNLIDRISNDDDNYALDTILYYRTYLQENEQTIPTDDELWNRWKLAIYIYDYHKQLNFELWSTLTNKEKLRIITCLS